jgi:hypothetical protein
VSYFDLLPHQLWFHVLKLPNDIQIADR